MRFSICIPTFQRREMLRAALTSALEQDFDDYEVVVSDNASSDGTRDFLASVANPKLRLVLQSVNVGSVVNHIRCVEEARGTWIVFLHDDDQLSRSALGDLARYLGDVPDIDVALPPYMESLFRGDLFRNCVRLLNGVSMSSTVYRRSLLMEHPFHADNVCCDWEALFLAARHGYRFGIYPREYLLRGRHPNQEGAAVVLDGRGLRGKANAISRLYGQLGATEWAHFCEASAREWNEKQLMTLARYVHHAALREAYDTLVKAIRNQGKWRWRSRNGIQIASETLLGRRVTFLLNRALKV